ncbi:MAG TPA: NUDIX domain-containing protein [Flavisolibacter sp.]|nr:NUDIX domain-containing protein [Flavisolibacter sp.]
MAQLHTAGLLVIRNKKLLLAFSRNKRCFYLPGGNVDAGETVEQALCREAAEELQVIIEPCDLRYHAHITAPAYGEQNGTIMEQDCFLLTSSIKPACSGEIGAIKYFSLEEYLEVPDRAPGAVMILEQLKAEALID